MIINYYIKANFRKIRDINYYINWLVIYYFHEFHNTNKK